MDENDDDVPLLIPEDFILGELDADPIEEKPTPPSPPTFADNALSQYRNLKDKSRPWAIALCKTSGALPFIDKDSDEFWVFRDNSVLWMDQNGALRGGYAKGDEVIDHNEGRRIWL